MNRIERTSLSLLLLWVGAIPAWTAEISAGISARETYVGLPVTLQVQIRNAADFEPPQVPGVDGLSIETVGTPSRSSQISIINGRRSESTSVTFAYRITPLRAGTYTIGPITVQADGKSHSTKAFQVSATTSETGDLMFVEVTGKQQRVYVGQALDLTLKIWIRPYRDQANDVVLSEGDMWKLVSEQSSWGPFAQRLQDLADENQRPRGKEVLRADNEGNERSYYLYEIDATVYPTRPGTIGRDEIRVIANYPTKIGRSRDPLSQLFGDDGFPFRSNLFDDDFFRSGFGSRLRVTSIRPIIADAVVEPIDVQPVPMAGRPDLFRGAVGKFNIGIEAKPTEVSAGDPITLHIGITGTGRLEGVQAPPLIDIPALAADFKIPQEPLAGIVNDAEKVFTTSIRPRRAGIKQIPPIPFCFFDPEREEFITVHSDPVTIAVNESQTLALDAIVTAPQSVSPHAAPPRGESTASLPAQHHWGPEVLQSDNRSALFDNHFWAWFALPPAWFAVSLLLLRRREWVSGADLFRSAARQLQRSLAHADSPAAIAAALASYVHRRLGSDAAMRTELGAIGSLRQAGYRALAIEMERLLGDCHAATDLQESQLDELRSRAGELANRLIQQLSQRRRPEIRPSNPQLKTTLSLLVATAGSWTSLGGIAMATDASHATPPTATVLNEANDLYRQSLRIADDQPAASQALAERAAAKYQFVVTTGIINSKLYFNLANAYQQSGQLGRAIANYHRALRLDPTDRRAAANLRSIEPAHPESATNPAVATVVRMNERLSSWIHPKIIGMVSLAAWAGAWMAATFRLLRPFPWKTITTACLVLLTLSATSYGLTARRLTSPIAVAVSDMLELRSGDGTNFDTAATIADSTGQTFDVLHRRGSWLRIRARSGQTGWVQTDDVEVVESA